MVQLLCNGVLLDIKADTRMTFTKSNPFFAFDDLKCERTAEFSLPATATNNKVFSLSKNPAFVGDGMRRRFSAEYRDGVVVKEGYLYVTKFNGTDYNAILVVGELLGLQRLRDAGKLKECITTNEKAIYGTIGADIDSTTKNMEFYGFKYVGSAEGCIPSISLPRLIERVESQLGVSISKPSAIENIRIIPNSVLAVENTSVESRRSGNGEYVLEDEQWQVIDSLSTNTATDISVMLTTDQTANVWWKRETLDAGVYTNTYYVGNVKQYKALRGITIEFPDNFPDDVYIGAFRDVKMASVGAFTFYGERSFRYPSGGELERVGEPLAGRSVNIPAGSLFMFVTEDDYFYEEEDARNVSNGWRLGSAVLEVSMTMAETEAPSTGNYVREFDSLPDVNVIELLKAAAAVSGMALNYTDKDGVLFDPVALDSWGVIDINNKTISRGDVERTFANYARKNYVQYDSEDNLAEEDRIIASYDIANDNIEESNDLITIPFAEGERGQYEGVKGVRLRSGSSKFVLCDATPDTFYGSHHILKRKNITLNAGIVRLCSQSTKVSVKVKMTAYEFDQLKPNAALLLAGIQYAWTDATWQDGIADLKLSKI